MRQALALGVAQATHLFLWPLLQPALQGAWRKTADMTDLRCGCCGLPLSDLQDIEPAARLPDPVFALPTPKRLARAFLSGEVCTLDWRELGGRSIGPDARGFVRAVMPFVVAGRERPFCWGVWIEVAPADLLAYIDQSVADEDGALQPDAARRWPGALANDVSHHVGGGTTIGLTGRLGYTLDRINGRPQRPRFVAAPEAMHPFAVAQRAGLDEAALADWLKAYHAMMAEQS